LEGILFLFGRKPDMTSIRMPQKRGGGFGNLGEAIRRMQEQRAVWVCQLIQTEEYTQAVCLECTLQADLFTIDGNNPQV
jgi:hypothetical protein